jgi:hypothetical protein
MLDTNRSAVIAVTTRTQNIVETDEIALDIHIRMVDTVANPCLGGKIDYYVKVMLLEELIHKCLIRDGIANKGMFSDCIQTFIDFAAS